MTAEEENANEYLRYPTADDLSHSNIAKFISAINGKYKASLETYEDLHSWSVRNLEVFWSECWDFVGAIGEKGGNIGSELEDLINYQFFPAGKFNLAKNCLRKRDSCFPAIIFTQENKSDRTISWQELYWSVSRISKKMRADGIKKGDRVCAVISNVPEAVICMLATASLGGIWSSVSPDFGAEGIIERFGQIEPKMLFYSERYKNKERVYEISDRIQQVRKALGDHVVYVSVTDGGLDSYCQEVHQDDSDCMEFEETSFNDPLFILFSSGTTGKPKCIVHRHGVLLQLMKEHQLHSDIRPSDRVFYYTTTTWMMWHWLVGSLASEATIMLYEGNPFFPDCNSLFEFASRFDCTFFGVSAKWIDSVKSDPEFHSTPKLPFVRMIASTGSPLAAESFDFVYQNVKKDVILASICGGTDILSCFMLGCPIKPVKRGFAQCRGLGMDVQVWVDGKRVADRKGELVCCKPFVSQPIGFWGDDAQGSRYKATYFAEFPNVWKHGDFVLMDSEGYLMVYGRSDATMKPGGVRIGTAEIYRVVENINFVREAICCGFTRKGGDQVVALFVTLKDPYAVLTEDMREDIRCAILKSTTRHHVPKLIEQVSDVPRTKNGKIVELAVKNVIHGVPVVHTDSLANPQALKEFEKFAH